MANPKLMQIRYYDTKEGVQLEAYADTVVLEKTSKSADHIAAIRFGGYPESVKGMAEAIFGGGSITIEMDGSFKSISSYVKRYRKEFSHDGIYAEATLMIQDEEQRIGSDETESDDGNTKKNTHNKPRKCYLFCEQGNDDRLFEEIDKKTAVPLISEFKDYVLAELLKRNILKPLQVISRKEKFDVWSFNISEDEKNIIAVVNDGLKSGAISIPSDTGVAFPEVSGVTSYLNTFGVMIAERIKNQFEPLFDPATESLSPEILAVNANIQKNVGYSLYDAQLAVAEAHKRCLSLQKATLCIAECGAGKTKIGVTALHAYQMGRKANKHFNITLCPSHMTKKWAREIEESLPNTFAAVITSITELNEVYAAYERDNKTCYIIMSKEKARDGYMMRPAVTWNKRLNTFLCPDCYEPIMTELISGMTYQMEADSFFFQRENKKNHKCAHCKSVLWTMLVPGRQSEWVKIPKYGFIHRKMARQHLEYAHAAKKPKVYDAALAILENPDGIYPTAGAYNRFALSTYIKRKMRGKIDGLIIDELHNYNNDSGQGDAMAELFQAAKKVVGMTATLINGYSSGIFYLLFRIAPHLMLKDDKRYDKSIAFTDEYGVTESVYEIEAPEYNSNRRASRKKVNERQLPGVSPLVYSRFLMDSAAFLSLNDMGKDLPEYEEIPIQLNMNDDVAGEYLRIETEFKNILKTQRTIAQKILSSYMGLLTVYPDQPYDQKTVVHPIIGEPLVVPKDMSTFEELHEKDNKVLEVVQRKVEAGERVLVYANWTRTDTQDKLLKLFTKHGYRAAILKATVIPQKREEWIEQQIMSGIQVLIANPSLCETGLDLNDFTTLYYYNIGYNLFTLRQSSRRSWRINQKAPRVEVYFTYYEGTMQHRAIRLMASKLAVAGIIESNFTDEGLAAMSDCADMTTALARELTNGIKNEVEDLSAVFKKMAILKPVSDVVETTFVNPAPAEIPAITDNIAVPEIVAVSAQSAIDDETSLFVTDEQLVVMPNNIPAKTAKKKKKATVIFEGQISLFEMFDFLDASA